MAQGEQTGCKVRDAVERLRTQPTIDPDDWAAINGVDRNTAYKELAAGKVEGAYRVGSLYRIPSAPWRLKLGLHAPAELAAEAA